ncbi:MAG TPA: UDP-3-O-[3-hydroxymyristoyl] N-acetylglucosamine deacetylase [Nitrospiraceae bacterium]|nr:UDP-3-O-[3-hydroxymyristoyl] N-acetylglucosamine deacetylase [Nitrospiraceae bacterium]
MRFQRTIKNTMAVEGIGLHSGRPVRMLLQPAAAGQGIVFIRTDLGGVEIAAAAENTSATSYATTLSRNNASIKTVEHLLAALAGLGIDNVTIEIDGEELPILDGSAAPFVRLIVEAGIQMQSLQRSTIKITKPIFVREGSKQVALWPADSPSISYFIDFDHPLLREQAMNIPVSEESFLRELADARTFGFLSDVQMLQANGLARGGSLENAVVLDEQKVLNKEGLRHRDEFVRHKILDAIGDLYLAGGQVLGAYEGFKSGHALNNKLVRALVADASAWEWVSFDSPTTPDPVEYATPAYA